MNVQGEIFSDSFDTYEWAYMVYSENNTIRKVSNNYLVFMVTQQVTFAEKKQPITFGLPLAFLSLQ